MAGRSDRLKKFETELGDLEQWLRLGLVPKKDIEKHKGEIETLKAKIAEEKERIQFLKESGETEEFTVRKTATRTQFTEAPTMPDMEVGEDPVTLTEMGSTNTAEATTEAPTFTEERSEGADTTEETTEEEDPFSDQSRWKRGMLHDEDNEW